MSGPPLLPGLMLASNCTTPRSPDAFVLSAEIVPLVVVISGTTDLSVLGPMLSVRPKGKPSACTAWPEVMASESPNARYGWFDAPAKRTARSRFGSVADIDASVHEAAPLRAVLLSGG